MEITAAAKFIHISPKKVRPWLGSLRKRSANEALQQLRYARSKAAQMIYKLIKSAVNNATNNYNFKSENLRIKAITVDSGPRYKRYWLRSHGAADVRLKRMAHLAVVLEEITAATPVVKKPAAPPLKSPSSQVTPVATAPAGTASGAAPKGKKLSTANIKRIFTRTTHK